MRRSIILISLAMLTAIVATAQKVTVNAVDEPAAAVFRSLITQTGKNFVYSSEILEGVKVTVKAKDRPLKKVLAEMFDGTGIEWKISGDNVLLKRRTPTGRTDGAKVRQADTQRHGMATAQSMPQFLDEVTVESQLATQLVETTEVGAVKVTGDDVVKTPVLFGEADVIRALHMQPGISEGTEGMAGMYVHGGNVDENLVILDNVQLYQTNHFAGLFSPFNPDIIRNIDFYKSSVPAKFDGRLSSVMDVRLINGSHEGHHGTARLGLTSGAFNISGPIGSRTTYMAGIRRSWYDVLSVPLMAIGNSLSEDKMRGHYYFMDLNAKVTHRFSERAMGFVSVYLGDDYVKSGSKDEKFDGDFSGFVSDDNSNLHWGNFMAQTGLNYRLKANLSAEFIAAYTRNFSSMENHEIDKTNDGNGILTTESRIKTRNNVNDWILRGDFDWTPVDNSHVRYGANYVHHSFLPLTTETITIIGNDRSKSLKSDSVGRANEFNAYIEDDWHVSDNFRVNAGVHGSLFHIDGRLKHGLSPRISLNYRPTGNLAVKAAYSRTVQYVHQLAVSYMSLPTDHWIPVSGDFKPETADKVSAGGYWQSPDRTYEVSAEGYFKWMHNLLDYRDEYYLYPQLDIFDSRLSQGKGTAKGIDLKIEKLTGKLTGHISYSLAWADRTFPDKNGGKTFPARFDNRHTINVLINWNVSKKVQLNASWTGHSGNRFTLLTQNWEGPSFGENKWDYDVPLREGINHYQLPFYHRLDLSCMVRNKRGYWTFGLYNAYNHRNVVAVWQGYKKKLQWNMENGFYWAHTRPVFYNMRLLPVIPSISYTWKF